MSILLHAPTKIGKSTLSTTAPGKICVIDVEGGWKFVSRRGYRGSERLRRKVWNPLTEYPPRDDGTWDFCHVIVQDWATLMRAYEWLRMPEHHDFTSIVVDSITEAQRRLKKNIRGIDEQMRIQDWGSLLNQMDNLIRSMRDLVLVPDTTLRCVVFIAETELKDTKWRPAMQGQIGRQLPYAVDICGYLFTSMLPDPQGQPTIKQVNLLIGAGVQPSIEAGERVQGALPDVIPNPDIWTMMSDVTRYARADFPESVDNPVI